MSALKHAFMVIGCLVMIYPLLWMIASSLRPENLIFSSAGVWVEHPYVKNYPLGWSALSYPFGHYLINSAIVVVGAVIGNVLSCSLAAYAFARLDFRGRNIWFAIMLMTIMLPIHVLIVPQYIIFNYLHWVNTFIPLILPKFLATDAFFIFLMVQFIRGIPRQLDEAARIDGCGHWKIFTRIILPLMVPAIATTVIFTSIWAWNDFFSALIYLDSPEKYTVPVALRNFLGNVRPGFWGGMFAMSIVSLLPIFIGFLVGQKFLIAGISTTGSKQ